MHELASLVDPLNPGGNPDLPVDHPFSNIQLGRYWSASVISSGFAWYVDFNDGGVNTFSKGEDHFVWCVRGQGGLSEY